ncbi:hypothetical protein AMS68_003653 [Peltaster fructicola]|uniref:Uncharacterized protein n=1 Tax=Peltaster fructicola TaxID=286661 RepID=A0A6H0XTY5_9PEZI|nr:hypothetical protein AMS68_003653 [Peltaster fructicola]
MRITHLMKHWNDAACLLVKPFPELSNLENSPILGVSVKLYTLMLNIRLAFEGGFTRLSELEAEVAGLVHLDGDSMADDVSDLLSLEASILVGQLLTGLRKPQAAAHNDDRLLRMSSILRRRASDDVWRHCHFCNWPVYTAGWLFSAAEDIELVRQDLHRRWMITKFQLYNTLRQDLELEWSKRGVLDGRARNDAVAIGTSERTREIKDMYTRCGPQAT